MYGCLLGLLVVVAQDRWLLNTSGHKTGFTVYTSNIYNCIKKFITIQTLTSSDKFSE